VNSGRCTGVMNHARLADRRDHVGRARNHGLFAEDRRKALDTVDAVLQRDSPGSRGLAAGGSVRLPSRCSRSVTANNTTSTRPDLFWIVSHVDILEVKVAERHSQS
jgi:hypothetical protein